MDAWMKAAQPGEHHKLLAKLAGSWATTSRMEMPGQTGPETKGTTEGRLILGDRFVEFQQKGEFMGKLHEGRGVLGYDNVKKKYVTVWMENMGTGILSAEGDYDPAKKQLTLVGEYADPISGGKVKMGYRWIWSFPSDTQMVFEMFEVPPPSMGKEYKAVTITYTKQ
jgi:hypothetical protein